MKPLLRELLRPLGWIMGAATTLRNKGYDQGWLTSTKLDTPIVSVGNLTVGGTGKTPVVIALAEWWIRQGKFVAILSRGYGRTSSGSVMVSDGHTSENQPWEVVGDEPALMARNLPTVPVLVDEDRIRGARLLIDRFHPDIILLDDAFQHRRLQRSLDIVLLSAGDTHSAYQLFPVGRLREPWSGLKRAHVILVTKSNVFTLSPEIKSQLNQLFVPWFPVSLIPRDVIPLTTTTPKLNLNDLKNRSILLVSGIGDPESFAASVRDLGIPFQDHLMFRDHQSFGKRETDQIQSRLINAGADLVLTTEKDAIRLEQVISEDIPVAYLKIGMELPEEAQRFILEQIDAAAGKQN